MSSQLRSLIFGGKGSSDDEASNNVETDAQPLFSPPPAIDEFLKESSPEAQTNVGETSYLSLLSFEEEDGNVAGHNENDNQGGHTLAQYSQDSHYPNLSQETQLSNISSKDDQSPPIRRNRGMSYQSEVYYGENTLPTDKSPQDINLSQGSSYISQMIYGHPDHYGEGEEGDNEEPNHKPSTDQSPSPPTKPKRKWQDDFEDDEDEQVEDNVNEIAANMLSALYEGKTLENPFLTLLNKEKPEDKADNSDDELTEEQRLDKQLKNELRAVKQERHQEWQVFRANWRRRKLDLREEHDVGDAYFVRARETLEPKLIREKEQMRLQQSQGPKKEAEEELVKEGANNLYYDSEDEQVDLLQRLSQSIEQQEAIEAMKLDPAHQRRKRNLEALEEAKKPFAESMDYWEQGKLHPDADKLEFYYPDGVVSRPGKKRPREPSFSKSPIVLKRDFMQAELDPNTYFQFPLHHKRFASSSFIHNRQLIRLAARCIAKASGQHDDRMLRALWQPGHESFRRLYLLLIQTQEYGQNMATFLGHVWKNDRARKLVAQRLGIQGQNNDFGAPPGLRGYTMEPQPVQKLCNKERMRLVKRYSLQKMPSSGGEQQQSLPPAKKKRSVVLPTVRYIHLPGTTPPIPAFPLDETSIVFGPADRHVPFRHIGGIDEATYKLTMSSLVTRQATLEQKLQAVNDSNEKQKEYLSSLDPSEEADSGDMAKLQRQLFALVEKAPTEAKSDLYKFFKSDTKPDIPLVQFYRAMMAFCSFAVSGCPQTKVHEAEAKDSESDDNPYNLLKVEVSDDEGASETHQEVSMLTMDEAATKICDFCEQHMKHNGLKAFPRIHLTYGLATIARLLPAPVAELFSTPLDHGESQTPFDVFRRTLEYLEEQSLLIGDDQVNDWADDEDLVRVVELEYAVHKAVEIFGLCIQHDPIEVQYHEWRLGALGSSLLLCSGHKMGSRALPFPSSHYKTKDTNSLIDGSTFRPTLEKFGEMRRATVEAFKLLVQLTHRQQGATRAHHAISSFWEWKQVVALVAGRSLFDSMHLKQICTSHFYHTVQWSSQARSPLGMKYVEIITRTKDDSSDIRLKQLAAAIESDPNDVDNWRMLVAALGPLGHSKSSAKSRLFCDASMCQECQLLREGFGGDHHLLEVRKVSGGWWGRDIVDWWYPHYLCTSLQVPDKSKTPQLMMKLENTIQVGFVETDDRMMKPLGTRDQRLDQSSPNVPSDLEWLWSGEDDNDSHSHQDEDEESDADDLLPKPIAEVVRLEERAVACSPLGAIGPEIEAIYLKLMVTCHLFGIGHRYSLETIYELSRRSVKRKVNTSCAEWHCLVELSRQGVDVVKAIQLYRLRTNAEREKKKNKRPTKPRFSESQREAVRDGLERFGYGKWKEMSHHYAPLNGLSRFVILDIYKWLQKNEGMEDMKAKEKQAQAREENPIDPFVYTSV